MTQPPIDQADLDTLAAALDGLVLTPAQRALLSAIVSFAAAASAVQLLDEPAPSFREQFAASFTPDQANLLVRNAAAGDTGRTTAADIGRTTAGDIGRTTAGDIGRTTAGDIGRSTPGDIGRSTPGDIGRSTGQVDPTGDG